MNLGKRWMGLVVAAFAAFTVSASGADAAQKLRIGIEGAYPPFNFVDSKGQLGGFDFDIATALCAKMAVECSFVKQDWDGIIPALNKRKFDAIVSSLSITEDRKKAVDFTEHYYINKLQFIGKKGVPLDTSV
ncbi:MAG: transporter substrate-binding domain-containing protein, partial [Rhodospirillaceae bacterium]|nr:transporter substrate-binding domain-containing protein [Rhodospirillaceae bacterium]